MYLRVGYLLLQKPLQIEKIPTELFSDYRCRLWDVSNYLKNADTENSGFFKLISVSVIPGAVSLPLVSASVILWVDLNHFWIDFLYLSFSGGFPKFISVSAMSGCIFLILVCTCFRWLT